MEHKDQKIGKYEEDGSEQVIGALIEVHRAQILTYMKLLAVRIGLLANFNVTSLRQAFGASRCRPLHLPDLSDLFVALLLHSGRGLLRAAASHPVESRY